MELQAGSGCYPHWEMSSPHSERLQGCGLNRWEPEPGLASERALRRPGLEPLRRAVVQLPVAAEHNLEAVERWRGRERSLIPDGRGW